MSKVKRQHYVPQFLLKNFADEDGMRHERRREIDLYKKYATDDDFKSGLHEALMRMMDQMLKSNSRPSAM